MCTLFQNEGTTVAALFKEYLLKDMAALGTPDLYQDLFRKEAGQFTVEQTTATLYNGLWDVVADIDDQVADDFAHLNPVTLDTEPDRIPDGAIVVSPARVHLGEGTELCPGAVIDASSGPVFVGRNSRIEPQAAIFGPCYIGYDSVVVAGKVSGSSIGHTCRVGGEVEESVFHSCVNKYHAGFIGHAYVGSWVNFGAMTTNSDLKNNYSPIRVSIDGEMVDTGSIKVGSFIGDHTKFGIGTLLNTGINIGPGCNVFGGGLVSDKEIPPFRWGTTGNWQEYQIDKAIETARRTTERRNLPLSDRQERRLRAVAQEAPNEAGVMNFDIPVPA
jgi:UDP-N-acetylglucosamine diphosphorylase/glucosamine-1-phosphate N-acetyltransferase